MSKTVRIDEETYRLATINQHQQNALSQIFTKLSAIKHDFTFIFEYDTDSLTITTSAWIIGRKLKIELPFIKRKNRIFRDETIIIPERYLFSGENMIYILRDLLLPFEEEVKFKDIIANIKNLEFETNEVG